MLMQMYEKAAHFFELASQVQPQEVKWQLMVASCFRRTGNQQQVRHPHTAAYQPKDILASPFCLLSG